MGGTSVRKVTVQQSHANSEQDTVEKEEKGNGHTKPKGSQKEADDNDREEEALDHHSDDYWGRVHAEFIGNIGYSSRYQDGQYEYRHVILPEYGFKRMLEQKKPRTIYSQLKKISRGGLLSEEEWRIIGVQQSAGWKHYFSFKLEPFVLPMRRNLPHSSAQLVKEFET